MEQGQKAKQKGYSQTNKKKHYPQSVWDAKTNKQKELILLHLALCWQKIKESRYCKRKESGVKVIDLTTDFK